MDRRAFLGITAGLLAAPFAAVAQPTDKVYRLGWLGPDPTFQRREWLIQDLRDLGYVDGRNVEIAYRFAKGHIDRLTAIAAEMVALKVDVIVAVSQPSVHAAQQATRTIPIVMFGVGDPVSTGLVANLARPGGNATGLSQLSPELSAKRLALLAEVVPRASRIAVLTKIPRIPAMPIRCETPRRQPRRWGCRCNCWRFADPGISMGRFRPRCGSAPVR